VRGNNRKYGDMAWRRGWLAKSTWWRAIMAAASWRGIGVWLTKLSARRRGVASRRLLLKRSSELMMSEIS
jgi:hypothetical protein